jgi:hypothetical protein
MVCSLALDGSSNVYVTGWTRSSDFPTTLGAYDESYNGGDHDAFVSKLDSSLSTLIASTYLGGGSSSDLTLDETGNVYVIGSAAFGFPTTTGAYDESYNGGYSDVFVSKLDSSLSTLIASTYLGGADSDTVYSLALDGSSNVYVTGRTRSSDFSTTPGAYREYCGAVYSVFVSKLDSSLRALLASTVVGGRDVEWGNAITLDGSGNVYVTGYSGRTCPPDCSLKPYDFPTTPGAYDESFNGEYDAFVLKLDTCLSLNDTYPPGGNGIGDTCDCEGNFNCLTDQDVDGSDAALLKVDFGRSVMVNPCVAGDTCNGDFNCDGDVDGSDASLFKQDFGRSSILNPCPACVAGEWCGY